MSLSFRQIGLWAVVAALAVGALYVAFRPQAVPVDLSKAVVAPMEVTIGADGISRIRNVFEVSAPVSGMVQRSPVKAGDVVLAGDTLVAVIVPGQPAFLDERSRQQAEAAVREAEAALRLSEANIAAAQANYEYVRDQYDRAVQLERTGNLTTSKLDEARLLLEKARTAVVSALSERSLRQSTVDRAKATLIGPESPELSGLNTCCVEIVAPVDGSVLSVVSASERLVPAGAALLKIGNPQDLEIVVDLLSGDAVGLPENAVAYVERWGGETVLSAEVKQIEPAAFTKISALGISEQRVRILLDFTSDLTARKGMGDGFQVFVRIIEWRGDDILQVPISSLFRDDGDWAVFKVVDGIAVKSPVEIGHRNASVSEVLGGIKAGDVVITHPSDKVLDGVAVVNRQDL